MGSWITCTCGGLLHRNLFAGTGIRVAVQESVIDQIPEEACSTEFLSEILSKGELLMTCTKCGRIAIEGRDGQVSFYKKEE